MKKSLPSRRLALAASLLSALSLSACSHYRGAGDYKVGADYPVADRVMPTASESPTGATFRLHWPVKNVRITQNFEPAKNPRHKGLDLGGGKGVPILAGHDGRVIYTGRHFHGYGNMVMVEFNDEWATLYAHLTKIKVRQGQRVKAGQTIGTMGRTGRARGVHLHFELMHKKEPVDPLLHIGDTQYLANKR